MNLQVVLERLTTWAVRLMELLGAPGAGLAIALENIFPPLPSEVVLPLAGFTASRGTFTLVEVIAWTTAGSVGGAVLLYALGARLGSARLRTVAASLPLLEPTDLDRAEAWFARYGNLAVLVGRMVPVVRSLISVPAGAQRMPIVRFVALTTVGSLAWNTLLIVAGYLLGEQWELVERYVGALSRLVLVGAAVVLVVFAFRRWRRRHD